MEEVPYFNSTIKIYTDIEHDHIDAQLASVKALNLPPTDGAFCTLISKHWNRVSDAGIICNVKPKSFVVMVNRSRNTPDGKGVVNATYKIMVNKDGTYRFTGKVYHPNGGGDSGFWEYNDCIIGIGVDRHQGMLD